jgi:hypothetical protein
MLLKKVGAPLVSKNSKKVIQVFDWLFEIVHCLFESFCHFLVALLVIRSLEDMFGEEIVTIIHQIEGHTI